MFDLSKKEVLSTLKNYDKIRERVFEVVEEIGFLTEEYDTLDLDKTYIKYDTVYVSAYDSYEEFYDSINGSFPLDFLFESEEQHKDWYKKKREEQRREKEEREKQQQKERELAELRRLKEKYE